MGRPFINSTRRTDISSTLKGEGKGGCEEVEEEVEEEEEEEVEGEEEEEEEEEDDQ